MAVIFTYPKVLLPDVSDLLLITDVSGNNKTKQTSIEGLKNAIDVVDSITALEPISISSSTGDVEISLTGINGFGTAGQVLAVNQAGNALEYVDSGGGGGSIEIQQTGVLVLEDAKEINVNSVLGNGLITKAKPLSNITVTPSGIVSDGTYTNLTTSSSGNGSGAILSAVVSGGTITSATITTAGSGYVVNDNVSVSQPELVSKGMTGASGVLTLVLELTDFTGGSLMPTNVTLDTIYDTQLSPSQLSVAVGGIQPNTPVSSLEGQSIVTILNKILFPTLDPVYFPPTLNVDALSKSPNQTYYEPETTVTITATGRGTKKDGGDFTNIKVTESVNGAAATTIADGTPVSSNVSNLNPQYGFLNENIPNKDFTISGSSGSFNMPTPSSGSRTASVSYKSIGEFNAGNPNKDSSGALDNRTPAFRQTDAPQLGTSSPYAPNNTQSVTSLHPWFFFYSTNQLSFSDTITAFNSGTAAGIVGSMYKNIEPSNGTLNLINYNNAPTPVFIYVAYPGPSTATSNFPIKQGFFLSAGGNEGGIENIFNPVQFTTLNPTNSPWSITGSPYRIHISSLSQVSNTPVLKLLNINPV